MYNIWGNEVELVQDMANSNASNFPNNLENSPANNIVSVDGFYYNLPHPHLF